MDDSNQYAKQVRLSSEVTIIKVKRPPSITNLAHKTKIWSKVEETTDKDNASTVTSSDVVPVSNDTGNTKNATNSFTNDGTIYELEDTPPMSKAHIQDKNNFQSFASSVIKMPSSPRLLNITNNNDNRSMVYAKISKNRNCGAIHEKSEPSPSSSKAGPIILNGHLRSLLKSYVGKPSVGASQPVSPPILLNAQLGKRPYISNDSPQAQKSFANKKKCYNLEGVVQNQTNGISIKPNGAFNNSSQKIINYIKQTRCSQVEKQSEKNLEKGTKKLHPNYIIIKNSSSTRADMPMKSKKLNDNQQVANVNALSKTATITPPASKDLEKGNKKLHPRYILIKNSSSTSADMPLKLKELNDNQQMANLNALSKTATITPPASKDLEEGNKKLHPRYILIKNSSSTSADMPLKLKELNDNQQMANVNALSKTATITPPASKDLEEGNKKLRPRYIIIKNSSSTIADMPLISKKLNDNQQMANVNALSQSATITLTASKDLEKGNKKLRPYYIITKNSSSRSADMPIKSKQLNDNQQVANVITLSKTATITPPASKKDLEKGSSTSADMPIKSKKLNDHQQMANVNALSQSAAITLPASNTPALSGAQQASSPLAMMPLLTNKNNNKPLKSVESLTSKTRCELKVKCLCRLMGDTNDANLSPYGQEELENFFHQMFEQTRKLEKQDQRKVKMALLQTVCEAEEMVERGKCCCF